MSYYDDESQSRRGRSQRDRDHSPDYHPGRPAGHPGPASQARLAYEPDVPFYPPPPVINTLQVPDSRHRPRSMPPPDHGRRSRNSRRDDDDDYEEEERNRDRDRGNGDRSPVGKAKHLLGNTFTDSTTGLGVGVLGALVGGLAAREASEAASRHNHHGRPPTEAQKRAQLLTTVVGAAVGALGANAVEKRIEVNREKGQRQQDKWEERWRPNSRGGNNNPDVIDRREVVTRPRRGSAGHHGWKRDFDLDDRDRGVTREVDPDARSWRNVEDWVYDDRDRDRHRDRDHGRGRRSDDQPQYRW